MPYLLVLGEGKGAEEECVAVGRSTDWCPCPSHMPLAEGDKYRGVADGSDIDSKRDATGYPGMIICPLPTIFHRPPGPTQIL